ncbi:MAG: DUF1189 domain-containing protein [Clostridia bacterium]|nr:DUF1189 domain-containing protein [Clostridia bacterium]
MKQKPQNKEEKDTQLKKGFFKKVWYSIDKIDKYSELAAEGVGKALKYLIILIIVLAFIASGRMVYETTKAINKFASNIDRIVPEVNYKDGKLSIESEDVIIDNETELGKVIIDTNIENEEIINKYIEDISEDEGGIIILKEKAIIRERKTEQSTINYSELFRNTDNLQINSKQELIDYIKSPNIIFNVFTIYIISFFIAYMFNALMYIVFISIFAYLATIILKLKIRYIAVFNMVIYAITLPTLLEMIYFIVNIFYSYTIPYFDLMYVSVATIYVMAAIFILKGELNKKQGEVQKIVEVEEKIREEKEKNKEEKKEESKKENKETKNKKEKDEEKDEGEEPEGSNA